MRTERLTWWKCPKCHGTGRVIALRRVEPCFHCDGTGNALIDGRARDHARRVAEIEAQGEQHGQG